MPADRPQVETRDIPPRLIVLLGLGFAVFIAVSVLGMRLFFRPDPPWTFHRTDKPAPQLQITPAADDTAYLREQAAILDGYGWRDPAAGLAIIPVTEAMRLVSEGHRATVPPPGPCTGAACSGATPGARTIP